MSDDSFDLPGRDLDLPELASFDDVGPDFLKWAAWVTELARLMFETYGDEGPIEECGEEYWREMYDAGASPQEARDQDVENFRRENPYD